jgi:predicted outer membrane repeat protein
MHLEDSSPEISFVTFHSNQALQRGGGLRAGDSSPILTNCTFAYNTAYSQGGGLSFFSSGTPSLENTIVAFSNIGVGVACEDAGPSPSLACSDVYGNAGGDWVGCIAGQLGLSGNITSDPLFCDPSGVELTIHNTSPCAPFSPPNTECALIGAWPVGCTSTVVAEQRARSWSGLKALYR